jgi:hypothetical protein
MTTNYQILLSGQDPSPLFAKWQGGRASLWTYTVTHRVLEIRVHNQGFRGYLCIYCGDVQHINGPFKWRNCCFEIETLSPDDVILRDSQASFELRAGVVGADEIKNEPY